MCKPVKCPQCGHEFTPERDKPRSGAWTHEEDELLLRGYQKERKTIYIRKKTKYRIMIPFIRMIISFTILLVFLPTLGLKATGLAYLFSIAVSRSVEMMISKKNYDLGIDYRKTVLMLLVTFGISLAALFYSSLRFDLIFGAVLLVSGVLICNKDLRYLFRLFMEKKTKKA